MGVGVGRVKVCVCEGHTRQRDWVAIQRPLSAVHGHYVPGPSMEGDVQVPNVNGAAGGGESGVTLAVHPHRHTHTQRDTTHRHITAAVVGDMGPASVCVCVYICAVRASICV